MSRDHAPVMLFALRAGKRFTVGWSLIEGAPPELIHEARELIRELSEHWQDCPSLARRAREDLSPDFGILRRVQTGPAYDLLRLARRRFRNRYAGTGNAWMELRGVDP